MKYQIKDLLNGAEAHRQAQLKAIAPKVKKARRELEQAEEKFRLSVDSLVPYLQEAATAITNSKYTIKEEYDALRELDSKISRHLRYRDIEYAQRDLDRLTHDQANLEVGAKSEIELWLLSLQDAGQTEISSNGVKTAGYDESKLTRFVVAKRKLEQEEALDRDNAA